MSAVRVPIGPAPILRRVAAVAIDAVLVGLLIAAIETALDVRLPLAILSLIGAVYWGLLDGATGRTLGRHVARTMVVDRGTGTPVGFLRAAGRYSLMVFSGLLLAIPVIVFVAQLRRDPTAVPLWDRLAGTVVVQLGTPSVLADAIWESAD